MDSWLDKKFCPNCGSFLQRTRYGLVCPRCGKIETRKEKQDKATKKPIIPTYNQSSSIISSLKLDSFLQGLTKQEGYKDQITHIEYLPQKKAEFGKLEYSLPTGLQRFLDNRQIKLYKHQTDAINYVRDGENVVIATPTASGKTLSFNLPVLETMLHDPQARALYIYPMKALENDQLNTLKIMERETGIKINPKVYDGDTPRDEKR
ncbi:MAG: DEAD/DEAH box helicase, partial [Candidatus Hodarchaeales archaeon]